jgi:hypothetical protein
LKCGITRDEQHWWVKDCEKCSNCGKIRENQHYWGDASDNCLKCGKLNPSKFKHTQFVIYPQKQVSFFDLARWQDRPIKYDGKVVGKALIVDLKTDGRVVITSELHINYANKKLGLDLVLRD